MKKPEFVHLHVHTAYSMLDGLCRVSSGKDDHKEHEDIFAEALKDNAFAVAITDHGVMSGAVEFYQAAKKKSVKPIIGCEVYEAAGSRFERKAGAPAENAGPAEPFQLELPAGEAAESGRPARRSGADGGKSAAFHLVLLAEDNTGYSNLIKLVSLAHLEGFYYKPRIDLELLAAHAKGLIGMSACLKGRLACEILKGDLQAAARAAGAYADIFGKDNFFLELQDHGLPEQQKVNRALVELSRKLGLPLVATNDVHYQKREHAEAHEVLLCLQTQTLLSDPQRLRYPTQEFYFKTASEMAALFGDQPEALAHTLDIAHRCNVEIVSKQLYPKFKTPAGKTEGEYLRVICLEGARRRYGLKNPAQPADEREKKIMDRLNYELSVIEQTGYAGYFLVVWDFVRFARERGIPVGPGRGSGAGSIVSYCMGITGLDPLRYNLVFERFLNPERVSPPDFDVDFCTARRDEIIEYVKQLYGTENVAQIAAFQSIGAKTAIRDVGRVLGIDLQTCDRLAKLIPEGQHITFADALKESPDFKKAYDTEEAAKKIMKYATVLEGLYRNVSIHAAGVVIADRPLLELLPLQRGKDEEIITQYEKDSVVEIGLLKADFLGLQTLTIMDETLRLIQAAGKPAPDLAALPLDDPETFGLLKRADTKAIFQVESKGMRELLRSIGPDTIEDLIAIVALFRPGPMHMSKDYVERKTGRKKIEYDHPLLEPILRETYGVMLYQEQVQQAAHVLAGYKMGEGDLLRRAMSKKDKEEMERHRAIFIERCRKHSNIQSKEAQAIFNHIAEFAGYGFNKSHSAGYAIIAYQTAYLKAHHPVEFMSAVLSNEIGNTEKLPEFIAEAQAMGIPILPPCINASTPRFSPEGNGIRFGLAGIKNIGEAVAEAIVEERRKNGSYKSLVDFCARTGSRLVNRKTLETLIKAGAMDCIENGRRSAMFNAIDFAMRRAASLQQDRLCGQAELFSPAPGDGEADSERVPDSAPWPLMEQLAYEKELLGVYLSGHPLSRFEHILSFFCTNTTETIKKTPSNTQVRLGGLLAQVERKTTRTGKPMAAFKLEDLHGEVEGAVFGEELKKYDSLLLDGESVIICGETWKREDGPVSITVREMYPLARAQEILADHASIHVFDASVTRQQLEALRNLAAGYAGPVPLHICVEFPAGEKVFLRADKSFFVTPSPEFIREVERLLGKNSFYLAPKKEIYLDDKHSHYRNSRKKNGS